MSKLRTFCSAALILSATVFGWSCGDVVENPTMSFEEAVEVTQAGAVDMPAGPTNFIVFSPRAVAAAKRVRNFDGLLSQVDVKSIDPKRGGKLSVRFPDYGDKETVRVEDAKFEIDRKSIVEDIGNPDYPQPDENGKYKVGMKVESGVTIDQVIVKFRPSGLGFSPAAKLTVSLTGDINIEDITGYHIDGDGTVTRVDVRVRERRGEVTLVVGVTGFSEYSWDDDDITDDDPCQQPGSGCWGMP